MTCAIVEKRNAERPNPEMTIPAVVARCDGQEQEAQGGYCRAAEGGYGEEGEQAPTEGDDAHARRAG